MTIDKNRAMIIATSITAIAGLLTALVNRFDPSEPTAVSGYEATSEVVTELDEDVEDLNARVKFLEQIMMKKNSGSSASARTNARRNKDRKKRKRKRLPSIDVLQQKRVR